MKKLLFTGRIIIVLTCLLSGTLSTAQSDTTGLDPLLLDEVVVTDYGSTSNLKSASSITTLPSPANLNIQGAANLLAQIPGMFTDGSTGDAFGRVYTRGISLSAEDDIGWYYMSLQEDGLPISAVQFQQYSPDFFLRPDVSHERVEVIKGGKSAVIGVNSPGGIVNFISQQPTDTYRSQDRATLGIHASGRPFGRIEGYSGGPIGSSTWGYDFSYLYRYDRGPRELDYVLNNGGQLKAGLTKTFTNGIISAKIKYLDDQVNRYTGVPATNWENPTPAFGTSFQNSALLSPGFENDNYMPGGLYEYNPNNGIQANEIAAQINFDFEINDWRITNRAKYTDKDLDWQTAIGGQPLGLDNFLTYFISGDEFPAGLINFRDVETGQSIAQVNNAGAFAVFQGLPPSFEYVNGSLPNDAIMGSGAWKKDDSVNEWMNELRIQKDFGDVSATGGIFASSSEVEIFTNASFIYSTYEPESRLLEVTLENPGEPARALSDTFGVSNYGALFYEGANIDVSQFSIFGDAVLDLTETLTLNTGLRYETISHTGVKERAAPQAAEGGLDGNPLTSFDNGPQQAIGGDNIDFDYDYLSYSIGANLELTESSSLFARYSLGNKAPELNFYLDNFANQPVNEPAEIQTITQIEMGYKSVTDDVSVSATAFYSNLDDVPYTNFVFDEDSNTLFYTPTQLNSSRTLGIELGTQLRLTDRFSGFGNVTLQNSELTSFSLYNANETITVSDDEVVTFDGNTTPHNPNIMSNVGVIYESENWFGMIDWNYMGSRYGNISNGFKLPAYSTLGVAASYAVSDRLSLGLRVTNLTNTGGLQNFFGPNQFGANSDAATAEFIAANPNQSFVVFPIMPRMISLSVDFSFSK